MLSLAEQIFLLSLDEATGHFHPLPEKALDLALSGALMMSLAEAGQLDVSSVIPAIPNPVSTGDALLDEILADVMAHPGFTLPELLRYISGHGEAIREIIAKRLVEKNILTHEKDQFLWLVVDERFPIIDHAEERQVRSRIREVVLEGREPSAADIAIISLVEACDLTHTILKEDECQQAQDRLKKIDALNPIGRTIIETVLSEAHAFQQSLHPAV